MEILIPHGDEADVDDDVAEAISMTFLCQELRCLPQAGGLFDQDGYLVWQMTKVLEAQAEKARQEAARNRNKP